MNEFLYTAHITKSHGGLHFYGVRSDISMYTQNNAIISQNRSNRYLEIVKKGLNVLKAVEFLHARLSNPCNK